jgi:hypothetical protein
VGSCGKRGLSRLTSLGVSALSGLTDFVLCLSSENAVQTSSAYHRLLVS